MINKKILLTVATVCLLTSATPFLSTEVSATNNNGYFFQYDNSYDDVDCTVSVNAYCPSTGEFLQEVSYKIKDESGSYVSFNTINGIYTKAFAGGEKILTTNSTGSLTVELPTGEYVIEPINTDHFSAVKDSIPFTISTGTFNKSIDIDYISLSNIVNISFSSQDALPDGCSIQVSNVFGEQLNFIESSNVFTYTTSTAGHNTIVLRGNSQLKDLPAGKYVINIISCPTGYATNESSHTIVLDKGETKEISVSLIEQQGRLSIINVDSAGKAIKGSACSIISEDNTMLTFTKAGNEYRYDPNGITNTIPFETEEPIIITHLPTGVEFTVNEVNTSTNYVLADPQKITLTNGVDGYVSLQTKNATGSLNISIKDEISKDPISGFMYTIESAATNKLLYFSLVDSSLSNTAYIYNENGDISAVEAGETGTINIDGMPIGDYIIKCKESPVGYVMNAEESTKSITPNAVTTYDIVANKSNVAVEIIDENEMPVPDVMIEIYNSNGEIVLTNKTNAKGKILLSTIAAGDYSYRIAEVPEGFSYDDETKQFSISSSGVSESLEPIILEKTRIQVSIGQQKDNNPLDNAVFVLCDTSGTEVSRALTSSDGIATFSGIGFGDYIIKQLSAPIGYKVSNQELHLSINSTYKNEGVFDLSEKADNMNTNRDSPSDEKEEEQEPTSKSFNIGELFFIIIGVLIFAFVVVSAISFYLKMKENNIVKEETPNENDIHSDSNINITPQIYSEPTVTEVQDTQDEDIKIFTPMPKKALKEDEYDLDGKSPEELRLLQEKLAEMIKKQDASN